MKKLLGFLILFAIASIIVDSSFSESYVCMDNSETRVTNVETQPFLCMSDETQSKEII